MQVFFILTRLEISIFKKLHGYTFKYEANKVNQRYFFRHFLRRYRPQHSFWVDNSQSPRQSTHAATQYSPFFLHEQFVEQGLFEESLHLQRTNLSKSAGAAGCSVHAG